MRPLTIPNLGLGLNLRDPATEIASGQMAASHNMLFSRGVLRTPYGFAKFAEDDLPLASAIIGLFHYQEQGRRPTDHVVAMTRTKLYRWDSLSDGWDDISPSAALKAGPDAVPSFVAFAHEDGITEDGTACFYHLLACDGGASPIYRWAGKFEDKFYELAGADGYHETDTPTPTLHCADQVSAFYNHVILLNPKTWDATGKEFVENPQTILWGKAGKVETDDSGTAYTITDAGAGYLPLVDTGGQNVWCAMLGASQLIVYQNNSIWYLYHVGGTDIFKARLQIPDFGLLSPGLIVPWKNKHYLVGSDFQPYEYSGGSSVQPIGVSIADALKEDIEPSRLKRCRMTVGTNGRRMWLFVVRPGFDYVTRAYGIDTQTGAWMVRDFEHLYDESTGITSAALVGGQTYIVGRAWQQDIDAEKTYTQAISEATTWEQLMDVVLASEAMMIGDSEGEVFRYSEDLTTDDGVNIPAHADSKIFDMGLPSEEKWWSTLSITAKGTAMRVSFRIDSFETEDEGWTEFDPTTLTDDYVTYEFDLNVTSDQLQIRIANYAGSELSAKKMVVGAPVLVNS